MRRNKGSKFWHCENPDMSHRGLVPNGCVPRYREKVPPHRLFPSCEAARNVGVGVLSLERLEEVKV